MPKMLLSTNQGTMEIDSDKMPQIQLVTRESWASIPRYAQEKLLQTLEEYTSNQVNFLAQHIPADSVQAVHNLAGMQQVMEPGAFYKELTAHPECEPWIAAMLQIGTGLTLMFQLNNNLFPEGSDGQEQAPPTTPEAGTTDGAPEDRAASN